MLRIIDANLNRIGEGLRVLEDVARFSLNDAALSQQLKTMRHELVEGVRSVGGQLLSARSVEEDVGIPEEPPAEHRADLPSLVIANSRRVQESLRVMEEFAKLPAIPLPLDSSKFNQARFALYELEQKLVSRLLRQDKIKGLTGLYVILDTQTLKGRNEIEVAHKAIRGGAKTIQLRDKHRSKGELLPIAQGLKKLCAEHNILFMVNDYLDLALAADADGLHLGQSDLPLPAARRLLPIDKIVGCSAATIAEALKAEAEGADYIAVGAIYPTPSKESARLAGLETLRQIRQAVSLPLVAIGGINNDNVAEVMEAGANAVAVVSAVLGAEDVERAVRQMAATIGDIAKVPFSTTIDN